MPAPRRDDQRFARQRKHTPWWAMIPDDDDDQELPDWDVWDGEDDDDD